MSAARKDRLVQTDHPDGMTAREAGLAACTECGRLHRLGAETCSRCGARIRDQEVSLQPVWALLITGILAYIPANTWPMLITRTFGRAEPSTIIGGAIDLLSHGSYFVAAVVLVASVVIPIAKFVAIGWLAYAIRSGRVAGQHGRHRLHTVVEFIGRWSMIDVFVVAVLAALVQLGFLARIEPGPAAAPFALSVIFTMLAAQWLDARAIWQAAPAPEAGPAPSTGPAPKA